MGVKAREISVKCCRSEVKKNKLKIWACVSLTARLGAYPWTNVGKMKLTTMSLKTTVTSSCCSGSTFCPAFSWSATCLGKSSYNISPWLRFSRAAICSSVVRGSASRILISKKDVSKSLADGRAKASACQHFFIKSTIFGGHVGGTPGRLFTRRSQTFRSVSRKSSPLYGSSREYISYRIMPTEYISQFVVYGVCPRRYSGASQKGVPVIRFCFLVANPKSQSLARNLESTRILRDFMSLKNLTRKWCEVFSIGVACLWRTARKYDVRTRVGEEA